MKIIWIDDKPEEMQNVIAYIFTSLWKEKILSKIYIMRDASNYGETIEKNIAVLNELVVGTFIDFLISENLIDDPESDNLYSLIHEPNTNQVEVEHENDDESEKPFLPTSNVVINKIKEFVDFYNSFNNDKTAISEDNLKSFFNYQDKKPIIMIDMCLYSRDFDKLNNQSDAVLFSMQLYNFLKNKGYTTYMYTSYLYPNNLIEQWKKIYEQNFKVKEEEKKGIKFFGRNGESVDEPKITLIEELKVKNND